MRTYYFYAMNEKGRTFNFSIKHSPNRSAAEKRAWKLSCVLYPKTVVFIDNFKSPTA